MNQIGNDTSVAEKLAQKLRTDALGSLIDEEALDKIAAQAIERAFFADRPAQNYSGTPRPRSLLKLRKRNLNRRYEMEYDEPSWWRRLIERIL